MVLAQAGKDGLCIRALAVITPGNPTGQVIPRSNIEDLIKVSKKHELAVIADEVYQVNVYNSNMKFDSFKKTIKDMGSEYDDVPLFSLQSISKGYYGRHPYLHLCIHRLYMCLVRRSWQGMFRFNQLPLNKSVLGKFPSCQVHTQGSGIC